MIDLMATKQILANDSGTPNFDTLTPYSHQDLIGRQCIKLGCTAITSLNIRRVSSWKWRGSVGIHDELIDYSMKTVSHHHDAA